MEGMVHAASSAAVPGWAPAAGQDWGRAARVATKPLCTFADGTEEMSGGWHYLYFDFFFLILSFKYKSVT